MVIYKTTQLSLQLRIQFYTQKLRSYKTLQYVLYRRVLSRVFDSLRASSPIWVSKVSLATLHSPKQESLLAGQVFEKFPVSSPKILLSLRYIGNYIGKIIQTRQGHCTHCNISQNYVSLSKCTRLHLSAYSFQKISGGACSSPPEEACYLRLLGTSPPNDKFQIEP